MEPFKKLAQELLDEITGMLSVADAGAFTSLVDGVLAAKHVVVAGDGRCRFVGGAFVRKLTRMGRSASLQGDASCRAAGKGDILIVATLDGGRGGLTALADSARRRGARVFAVVGEPSSVVAASADAVIALTPQIRTPFESISGGGRASRLAFDDAVMLYLDAVILALQDALRSGPDEKDED